MLFAYGVTVEMLVGLINAGLATATTERLVAGNKTMEVARVRITGAGRQALSAAIMLESMKYASPWAFSTTTVA